MKKAYLSILYLITLVCVVIGLARNTGAFSWGKFHFWSSTETVKKDEDLTGIGKEIDIAFDCDMSDITIKTGANYHINTSHSEGMTVDYETGNDFISIKQVNQKKFNNFNWEGKITLTIPADTKVKLLNIQNNLGDIHVEGIDMVTADIRDDLGDVDFKDVYFDNMKVKDDLGNIKINSRRDLSDFTIDATVSLGSLKIGGTRMDDEYHSTGSQGTLNLVDSLGDIKVTW